MCGLKSHLVVSIHTRLGSRCYPAPQRAIQKLMSSGGTGSRHQPGCGFMEKQLQREEDERDERQRRGRAEGGVRVMMTHTGCLAPPQRAFEAC